MQDLNEDLDDLFRHAVDKYTLKPVDSKWDELSGKIISIKRPSSLADTIRSKYIKWMMLLALIILLPLAIISVMTVFNGHQKTNVKTPAAAVQKNETEIVNQKSTTTQRPFSHIPDTRVIPAQGQTVAAVQGHTDAAIQGQAVAAAAALSNTPAPGETSTKKETASNGFTAQDKNEMNFSENNMNDLKSSDISNSSSQDISNPTFSKAPAKQLSVGLAASDAPGFAPIHSKTDVSALEKEAAPLSLNSTTQKNLPLQHLDYPRRQGFYLGLVAGPMLTQVKHQGLKKTGFDFGLLAGYTLSKKISIETGLLYTNQYYFVTGSYYNELGSVTHATGVEGSRNALEIPLNLKYNIVRRTGGNFFISVGVSTYVGVDDKVLVHVPEGVTIPPSQHLDYGVTSYLPSYVNISLGYEYKIGKFADIRIEPYFQIPLNYSTGNSFKTGDIDRSIQVFNSGIHIGITRFIR